MRQAAVLTGEQFLLGDHAIAEGAIAAGCRFFGGYPITPSTEVAERMAERLPAIGGLYVQMEDEIASIAAVLGASWAGHKAMTATSGPGFSLMLENFGLGIMTETPALICNVQRAAPSTGLPTLVAQGDMMQARWGSHGHYEIIALTPWTAQECFDLTIKAINFAERYRLPVILLADAEIGHLMEKVVIPPADRLTLWDRKRPTKPPGEFRTYEPDDDLVPPMPRAGDGYHVFVESLTHDEKGYPVMTVEGQSRLVTRLVEKIRRYRFDIYDYEENGVEGADVVVLSYGISARIASRAIEIAREAGLKVGFFRLRTAWPFPEERVRELSRTIKGFVVPELNLGQMVREVERCAVDRCGVLLVGHAGGDVHEPEQIVDAVHAVAGGKAPCRADLAMSAR
ncbi:MAG: 2-oxoacid:acceptor oxidoreductase subunit alpha [Candidatus Rokubacteria bacterium]|nr:2-oxoacid:acceptor oxidoreductase subunit alpha [Candidatus Rokubacteria bacterium]